VKAYRFFATRTIGVNRVEGVVNAVDDHYRLVDNGLAEFNERIKERMTIPGFCAEKPDAVDLYHQRS
jgi:hypothetical protein